MQTVKFKVWLIGATLSVAPIFYFAIYSDSALAQSGSSQGTSMVLEMQQLRAEIAELRDQLERQQYQIRQLQRSLQQGSSSQQNNPVGAVNSDRAIDAGALPQSNPYAPGASAPGASAPGAANQSASAGENDPRRNSNTANDSATGWQTEPGQSSNPSAQAGSQALPSGEDDFYRPLPQEQSAAVVNENPEVVSAARQARQADNTYPPVIDRSIGAPAGSPAPSVSQGPGSQTAPTATSGAQADTNLSVPPSVATSAPQVSPPTQVNQFPSTSNGANVPAGGGVIQIPRNSVPAGNQVGSPVANAPAIAAANPLTPVLAEDEYYQQGFDLLKQSRYAQAVDVFKEQIERYPDGGYADDAHYWIAESMYLNRSLPESKKFFRAIIDNFQQSPRLPDAMLKTAYIEQEQGNEIEARILLQEIIQYHPRSDAAISAKNRLEKLD